MYFPQTILKLAKVVLCLKTVLEAKLSFLFQLHIFLYEQKIFIEKKYQLNCIFLFSVRYSASVVKGIIWDIVVNCSYFRARFTALNFAKSY